jgi:DNA-binding IclR family transcriptional regulator
VKPATTITKVCRVLDEFRNHPSIGITDLAKNCGLLPSDVHRILNSLQSCGYIEQDPGTRRYRLGLGLMRLGLTVFQRHDLRDAARPLLQNLSQRLEGSSHMAVYDPRAMELFLVEQINFPTAPFFRRRFGATEDCYCTALGRVVLANMDAASLNEALDHCSIEKKTAKTITDRDLLEKELAATRRRGYGLDCEEYLPGVCCIGAPVHGAKGDVVAAISVSMVKQQFDKWNEDSLGTELKAVARQLSALASQDSRLAPLRPSS